MPAESRAAAVPVLFPRVPGPGPTAGLRPGSHAGRRYTAYVSTMRIALPAAALVIVGALVVMQDLQQAGRRFSAGSVRTGLEQALNQEMLNPQFRGIDENGRPFTLSARVATPDARDAERTNLTAPRGDLTLESGRIVRVTAERGAYRRDQRVLDLAGEVTLTHDQGFRLVTQSARVDLAGKRAEGSEPIQGSGPDAELSGQGFRVEDDGNRIIATGRSRLVMRQATRTAIAPEAAVAPAADPAARRSGAPLLRRPAAAPPARPPE